MFSVDAFLVRWFHGRKFLIVKPKKEKAMTEELIPRITLVEMVAAWEQSCADIRQAFAILVCAEKRLKDVFKSDSYKFNLNRDSREYRSYDEPERLFKELKKDAWKSLLDRMEIRRLLSVKRCNELDKQLETGEGLPDIEVTLIMDMLGGLAGQLDGYMEEAVKEVFEFLRPHNNDYKTNSQFEVGKRVILGYCIERNWSGGGFHLSYSGRQNEIRALDNIFHLLDGNGIAPTHHGPLADAIEASTDGRAETKYFRAKCYANRNLHLEFLRMDLVAKLNAVAGGARLRGERKTA